MFIVLFPWESSLEKDRSQIQRPERPRISCRSWQILRYVVRTGCCIWCWNRRSGILCSLSDCLPDTMAQVIKFSAFVQPFKIARPKEYEVRDKVFPNQMHEIIRERRRETKWREMRQNRYAFYSACFSPVLLLGTCGCKVSSIGHYATGGLVAQLLSNYELLWVALCLPNGPFISNLCHQVQI